MALAATALLILLPLQTSWAGLNSTTNFITLREIELPAALAEDDSFYDLPFEQLRQVLREEVEREPQKELRPYSSNKKYN